MPDFIFDKYPDAKSHPVFGNCKITKGINYCSKKRHMNKPQRYL